MSYHYQVRGHRLPGESPTVIPTKSMSQAEAAATTMRDCATINRVEVWYRATIFAQWQELEAHRWVRTRPKIRDRAQTTLNLIQGLAREKMSLYQRVCDVVEDAAHDGKLDADVAQAIIDGITNEFKQG